VVGIAAQAARRLVLVSGEREACERWVISQLATADKSDVLWVAASSPSSEIAAIRAEHAGRYLGSECRLLVLNMYDGLHPDAFAALPGTLRGGGDCVLLAPCLADWADFVDPDYERFACYPRTAREMRGVFLDRLVRIWRTHSAVLAVTPDSKLALRLAPPAAQGLALNGEQEAAVAAVQRVALGHARRPLVISADRGRGKSTALGIAAARLLLAGLARVTVVAAHRRAVATLFAHAQRAAGLELRQVADTAIGDGWLCFRLPSDCAADTQQPLGLVLVDEAAAIPVAVLTQLLQRSNRLVFASTVHGYEGSGRGFELRFRDRLTHSMPQWRELGLRAPVRWAPDDPLEALINTAFLLDTDLADRSAPDAGVDMVIEKLDAAALAADESLLREVFGLLVSAHYQTRPSDLRQLLDNPETELWVAQQGNAVVGVLMALIEGDLDEAMAARIAAGERRPRGHLLPQSLAVHAGLEDILRCRVLRVQRLAVRPQRQRQGVATRLITSVADWAMSARFDLLGCAYGVDSPLLRFWQSVQFLPARCGIRVDSASALHSLLMLRGLNERGTALATEACWRFRVQLPWALGGSLNTLDGALGARLLRDRDCEDVTLSVADRRDLGRVAAGGRQPATAEAQIWKALVGIAAAGVLPAESLAPLIAWQLQHQPVGRVCDSYALRGRRDLEASLRAVLEDVGLAS
jgi:tRNA(Met) cytidine acetyltransferase